MINKNGSHDFLTKLIEAGLAGLNTEWSLKVANGEISLDDALGAPDMDAESEFDPNFCMVPDGIIDADDGYDCGCRGGDSCCDCMPF